MMEEWRPVTTHPDHYEVSRCGKVRSCDRVIYSTGAKCHFRKLKGRVLRPGVVNGCYLGVSLWRDHVCRIAQVHILVLVSFVGPRPLGRYGCHDDGNPSNNDESNLYWGTPVENSDDKRRHGTHREGEAISWAKLNESDVLAIRALAGSVTQDGLACRFGVRQSQISRIVTGKEWKHLLGNAA
jgi:hypothetical protein